VPVQLWALVVGFVGDKMLGPISATLASAIPPLAEGIITCHTSMWDSGSIRAKSPPSSPI
jgi:hypothetical protein